MHLLAVDSRVVDGPGAPLREGPVSVALPDVTFGYGTDVDVLHGAR